jgi:sugar phosphate isomerase/epimerase
MLSTNRRNFLKNLSLLSASVIALPACGPSLTNSSVTNKKLFFDISLAQWSLHKSFFSKKISTLDFPYIAKNNFGIDVVEYVNQFFPDKATDKQYLKELLKNAQDNGIKNNLIMIDGEGSLADLDQKIRMDAVEKHKKWVDAAKFLGCETIRVNAFGVGSRADVHKAAVEGLSRLSEYAEQAKLNVIVENHGGYTSDASWIVGVMKEINKPNVGLLPDFGNFCIKREGGDLYNGKCIEDYDQYKGVAEMMPFSKGVSAKTFNFNPNGDAIETDYYKMLKIIKDSGFKGYMGIEYEGETLSEEEGINKSLALLKKVGAMLS